jgi:hypothetical protein
MSNEMAQELFTWLWDTVNQTIRTTRIRDRKGELGKQLRDGVIVIGRASLRTLEGRVDAYPWVFPHEYGAEIHPLEGQYLTVPIFYALRPDGTPKYRNASAWKRWGSFVYTRKSDGKKFIAYKSATGELRILYVLVDKTDIPARLGLNRLADSRIGLLINTWAEIWIKTCMANALVPLWEDPLG